MNEWPILNIHNTYTHTKSLVEAQNSMYYKIVQDFIFSNLTGFIKLE